MCLHSYVVNHCLIQIISSWTVTNQPFKLIFGWKNKLLAKVIIQATTLLSHIEFSKMLVRERLFDIKNGVWSS